jgi:hypothetical protein
VGWSQNLAEIRRSLKLTLDGDELPVVVRWDEPAAWAAWSDGLALPGHSFRESASIRATGSFGLRHSVEAPVRVLSCAARAMTRLAGIQSLADSDPIGRARVAAVGHS